MHDVSRNHDQVLSRLVAGLHFKTSADDGYIPFLCMRSVLPMLEELEVDLLL